MAAQYISGQQAAWGHAQAVNPIAELAHDRQRGGLGDAIQFKRLGSRRVVALVQGEPHERTLNRRCVRLVMGQDVPVFEDAEQMAAERVVPGQHGSGVFGHRSSGVQRQGITGTVEMLLAGAPSISLRLMPR